MNDWALEQRVHALTARLYEAALDPGDWPGVLDAMADFCGGMGITVFPMRPTNGAFTYVSGAITEAAGRYFSDWIDRCPRIAYDARSPIVNRCFWDGDILDEDVLRSDPYFHDYAPAFDLRYSVVRTTTALSDDARHVISSPYSLRTGKPSDENIARFALLSDHAARAMRLSGILSSAEDARDSLSRIAGQRDCGIVILNDGGFVTHVNATAEAMCGNGISISGRRLSPSHRGQAAALARILAAAVRRDPARPVETLALQRAGGQKPLLLTAIPLRADDRGMARLLAGPRGILVTLVDPEAAPLRAEAEAFVALGLSRAEARIAAALGIGMAPGAVADEFSLSTGTVRNHLKSIYAKLGVSRQSELVALAARLADLRPGA